MCRVCVFVMCRVCVFVMCRVCVFVIQPPCHMMLDAIFSVARRTLHAATGWLSQRDIVVEAGSRVAGDSGAVTRIDVTSQQYAVCHLTRAICGVQYAVWCVI